MLERKGMITDDGLGWTFQCNVLGHYILARKLLPLLYKSQHAEPRIAWTGSLDGLPEYYDPANHQAIDTGYSYQSTKFQVALTAWAFNDVIERYEKENGQEQKHARSFIVHPGVTAGNMFTEIGQFLSIVSQKPAE